MHVDLLGPLRIQHGNEDVTPSAPKLRQVFSLLATCANTVVLHERFIEELWEYGPPNSVTTTLQTYVYQLRKVPGLTKPAHGRCRADAAIPELRTSRRGYTLLLPMINLDSFRFEDTVRRGVHHLTTGNPQEAAAQLGAALRMWRGPALADVEAGPILTAERLRLEELRRNALERRIEADLLLGRHAELIGELTGLVTQYPTNEKIAGQLILALHRSNHRAQALQAYERIRSALVEQLGLDPSRELQRLHRAVLNSDESLTLPEAAPPVVTVRTAPCHLPQRATLVDREHELSLVTEGMSTDLDAPSIVMVTGPPGVGKTAFAVQAAYDVRDRYPDGQLFARLTDAKGNPADTGEILRGFLRALGLPDDQIPRSAPERSLAFRSHTADRRVLVVLDDVVDPDLATPLAPIGSGCGLLAVGRALLGHPCLGPTIELRPLGTDGAIALLAAASADKRIRPDNNAVKTLVDLCGGLPAALRACADRLRSRPHWSLDRLIAWIEREQDEAGSDPLNLRAGIERTYWCLSPETREVFGLFTAQPSGPLSVADVAEALALDEHEAETLLETLVEAQLVTASTVEGERGFRYGCLYPIRSSGRRLPLART